MTGSGTRIRWSTAIPLELPVIHIMIENFTGNCEELFDR